MFITIMHHLYHLLSNSAVTYTVHAMLHCYAGSHIKWLLLAGFAVILVGVYFILRYKETRLPAAPSPPRVSCAITHIV